MIMLCLGFLMMIGFSLTAEGLGFHIPKGYLYAAIGFSILIEVAVIVSIGLMIVASKPLTASSIVTRR